MQTEHTATDYGCRASTMELHQNVIERAIRAMHEHIDTDFPLQSMAEAAMCSPFHFDRVFRQRVGITPRTFFGALRLQAAKRLLLTTSLSVIDVCFEVGYNSLGTFTTRFTQMVGLPPNKLRKLGVGLTEMEPIVDKVLGKRAPAAPHPSVSGTVKADEDFEGLIFVGLFREPIPRGPSVGCAILESCGRFHLPRVPDGRYYIFATGQPRSEPPLSYLLADKLLRGSSGPAPLAVRHGSARADVEITLRRAALTDPPILSALPLLLDPRKV